MRRPIVFFTVALGVAASAACSRATPYRPVMTVKELMEATVEPTADVVFGSAVWINGELTGAPKNEEEWENVEHHALTLAETGNLLMMAPRARDQGLWMSQARDFILAAQDAATAAHSRDVNAMFKAGGALVVACDSCHAKYPAVQN